MVVKTVGIVGVTGKFARCVLDHLLKDPSIISEDTAVRSSKGCDVVICCYLGDNELITKGQKVLVDACELEAAPRFIASDYTLDYRNLEYGQLPPKDPMKEVYDHLQPKQIVKGVHVLIGVFMETFFSPYFGIYHSSSQTLSSWGTGDEIWESTTCDIAAEFVAVVALDESALGFQRFLGDRKNIKQIAQAFQETYGQEATLKHLSSLDDLYYLMLQTQNEQPGTFCLACIYYYINDQTCLGTKDLEAQNYPNIKPITFKEFIGTQTPTSLSIANANVGSHLS